ncbi:MAG: general secretion pathway protein GspK [Candidatus Omnitrophota bacterium]|nr:MAG: general secretion pathway protein GspK [Candidatus Omnitrophota bacterium]
MNKNIVNTYSDLKFPAQKRATILALTLWSLCILSIFGIYLSRGVRQKIHLVKSLSSRNNLSYIAEAGIQKAIIVLVKDTNAPDTLSEDWSNNPTEFHDVNVGPGIFNVYYAFSDEEGNLEERYGVLDEEGKININRKNRHVIKRLIEVVAGLDEMKAQELAASIVDWRDPDSFLSIPLGSAEDSYYTNLPEPYDCKDDDFQVLEELHLVKGMNKEIFNKIEDYITVHGNGVVNINTASREVLAALGIDELLIDKIISYRAGDDELQGSGDDNIFGAPANIVPKVSQYVALSSGEVGALSNLVAQGVFGTTSQHFTIKSRAQIGSLVKEIICVVNKEGTILSWSQP